MRTGETVVHRSRTASPRWSSCSSACSTFRGSTPAWCSRGSRAVSVDALFDRLSQYFRPIAIERGLDLRFRSDGEWVTSDVTLLEQVLSNLVSNALRYTAKGGVLIAARNAERDIRFEVWDTGIGIVEADRQRIFEEFVQLGNPERDRRKGLGLGLSIAQRSAALIGGMVECRPAPDEARASLWFNPRPRRLPFGPQSRLIGDQMTRNRPYRSTCPPDRGRRPRGARRARRSADALGSILRLRR